MKMHHVVLITLSLIIGVSASGTEQQSQPSSVVNEMFDEPGKVFLWGQGTRDGTMFDYYAAVEQLERVPEWFPEKSDPPFSIPKAVAVAMKAAKNDNPQYESFMPAGVQMMRASWQNQVNRWFYIISLYPVMKNSPSYWTDVTVVVLMSGEIIKPIVKNKESG